MTMSLFENFDNDWEMTVLPHPKAPGIAVVPPCTHLTEIQMIQQPEQNEYPLTMRNRQK
jgi:hypothetical protein